MAVQKEVIKCLETLLIKQKHLQTCLQFIEQDRKITPQQKSKKIQSHKLLSQRIESTEKSLKNLKTQENIHLSSALSTYSKLLQNLEDFINPILKSSEFQIFNFFSDPNNSFPVPIPPPPAILAQKPITRNSLCLKLNKIVTQLKLHSHPSYSDHLLKLESSTSKLKSKSIYLQQEVSDHLKQVKSYLARLKSLEL